MRFFIMIVENQEFKDFNYICCFGGFYIDYKGVEEIFVKWFNE